MNRFQKQKIDQYLKEHKQSLDDIQQAFIDALTINQVSNEQAAALMVAIMRNLMLMPHNAKQLQALGIEPSKLSIDAVTELINVWAREYAKSL